MQRVLRLGIFGIVGLALAIGGLRFMLGRGGVQPIPVISSSPAPGSLARGEPTAIPRGYVSRDMMGADWPLTVDYGDVACEGKSVTFRSPMGDTYAVNAPARSQMKERRWLDIFSIDKPGADLFALIDIGLQMCK